MSEKLVFEDIQKAAQAIKASIKHTPILKSSILSSTIGNDVYLKLENLQQTGSFKVRGALNKIANLTEDEKKCGVIAASAGNHAQGVALGATAQNIKSTIVMPATAPIAKIAATKGYGAEVVLEGLVYDDAFKKACEIQKQTNATFLHPFDDKFVIAGQGTIGLEIASDVPDIDIVIVPIGGGGILAGIAKALKSINPNIKVIGVEAENAASMKEAIKRNEVCEISTTPTIADGIAVRKAGNLTFEIIKENVDDIVTVSEDEIARAILFLMEKNKIVVEGAGATPVAALLAGKIDAKNKKICAVVSGGNIDINLIERIMNKALMVEGRRYKLSVILSDKSGELEKIVRILSESNANILTLNQTMYEKSLGINKQKATFIIECFDTTHKEKIKQNLNLAGYEIL